MIHPSRPSALYCGLVGISAALSLSALTVPIELMPSGRVAALSTKRKKPMTPARLARKRKNKAQRKARKITRDATP